MKIAILRDHSPESSAKWENACRNQGQDFQVIDMMRNDWLEKLEEYQPDYCVSRPPGDLQMNKKIFDEKIFMLDNYSKYGVYPNFMATYIYENKSALAWFLKTNNIPHPATFVTSNKKEALSFLESTQYPIVGKTLIGASGSGVKILYRRTEAELYIQKAFGPGIRRRIGPNRKTGNAVSWAKKAIKAPAFASKRISQYKERFKDAQKGIVLFQEYIEHDHEWRCIKIGDSYFAYKKLKINDKASGAQVFEYGPPPVPLLDYTKELCERFDFTFMSIDFFYNNEEIYINELQVITGHSMPYICKVEDKPGRYRFRSGKWIFEKGDFNTNESYDIRLSSVLERAGK